VTLSGYVALGLADAGLPPILVNVAAWVVPVLGGMLIGAINGFFVAYLKIPAIVVTLGMFSILKGGLILVAGGNTLYNLPEGYSIAMEDFLGIPVPVWIMIVLTGVAFLWMRYSRTGRSQYAVGGNAEAARLSGLDTRRILMTTFILSGLFAGIASVMYATQYQTIQAVVTPGLELQVITASVVGGVSILGGVGTVIGSTLAAILIRFIGSALVFVNISPFWVKAILGILILVTVLSDVVRRRRQERQ
jgi:ribose/xylose/arabinose/galactoside ABC-type transport system permease subunit